MNEDTSSFNSLNIGSIVFEGIVEVIGQSGVGSIRNLLAPPLDVSDPLKSENTFQPFDLNCFCKLEKALESQYGQLAGKGILLLSGRASFKYLTRLQGIDNKLGELTYRLLPTNARMKAGLEILAETIFTEWETPTRVTEDNNSWYLWSGENLTPDSEEDKDCFYLFLKGLLQEFTSWVSGGRYYEIEEPKSMASAAQSCRIQVTKVPLD